MKRFLLATTAAVCAGPLYAADLPVKAPPRPPVVPFSWTSCYLGGQVGAGWAHATVVDPNTSFGGLFAPTGSGVGINQGVGALGGGELGCDYQFASNWVIGAAGDFSFADINGNALDPYFAGKNGGPITLQERTEWVATAAGRVGYAFDHWLLYGKGGAAWVRNSYTLTGLTDWGTPANFCANAGFVACNPTGKDTRAGWTAGFGAAYALSDAWSAGIEYDHYNFGSHTVMLTDPNASTASPAAPIIVSQRIDAIKFTLDYHFGRQPHP